MKHVSTLLLLVASLPVITNGQAGGLDITFGTNGKVSTDVGLSTFDDASAVVVQADGRILAAGTSGYDGEQDFGVVRYLPDGSLDPTFGTGGTALISIVFGNDVAKALAIQPDGKVLVGGYVYSPNGICFGLARLYSDGTPDATFGTNGQVMTNYATDVTYIGRALAVQSDGRILLAGGGVEGFAVVRYEIDGSVDSTFGIGGVATCAFSGGIDQANAMAIQPDGMILVGGYASGLVGDSIAVARFDDAGVLDPTFGTGGKVLASAPLQYVLGTGMVLATSGQIYVCGYTSTKAIVGRLNNDGSVDNNFNGYGFNAVTVPGHTGPRALAMALQADGKVLLAGHALAATQEFLLLRFNDDGTLDSSFDLDGMVTTDFTGTNDIADAIMVQDDGAVILAGYTNAGAQDLNFALARYLAPISTASGTIRPVSVEASVSPVPITDASALQFELAGQEVVTLSIYDMRGALVRILVDGRRLAAGLHRIGLDPLCELPAGLYQLVLRTESGSWARTVFN